ncbi:uracil-DNA glycosylase family protein [Helicobacter sp.]|uniref:uracil-DNA glycosylase family protein n=1 Tax=Helicobacter sp. TaxID=218 RepID=UPI00389024FE
MGAIATQQRQLYELYLARACGVRFVELDHEVPKCVDSNQNSIASTIVHCKLCTRSTHAKAQIGYIDERALVAFVVEMPMGHGTQMIDSKGSQMICNIAHKVFGVEHFSILSLLKCATHPPSPQEIELCKPYLISQIQSLQASCVVLFGEVVLESLLGLDSSHKGALLNAFGKRAIATHSVAALLRNPSLKKQALEHFGLLKQFLPSGNPPRKSQSL